MSDRRQPVAVREPKLSHYAGPFSWLTIFCLLAALLFSFGGSHSDAKPIADITPQTHVTDTPVKYKTLDIKDVQIGERLLGENPIAEEVDDFVPKIIPSEWRLLYLTMDKANGKRLDMQFLRPVDWIKAHGAERGATIDLNLPEFGAQGSATVVSIEACPPIKSGSGNVVTGKFIHESDGNLINLIIEGQPEATTVTANHRYWSADRDEFVEAGHLNPGEQVQTLAGLRQIVSINPRASNETVYNLEVQGEHVYLVGSIGTLVHNTYPDNAIVVRGGSKAGGAISPDGIRNGSGVTIDINGKAHGISVQAGNRSVEELGASLRNKKIGVTTTGKIREVGGTIEPKPRFPGDNHAEIGDIFPEVLSDILNEIINPAR